MDISRANFLPFCQILLIGCGELGSRHLQAVASLKEVGEIHVVDPREESLKLGQTRLKEINDLNPAIKFFWQTSLDDIPKEGALCIVATQAKGRCAIIKDAVARLGYKNFLIEKIVSQSAAEYQDLMEFCVAQGVQVWVNCKTRAYGIHEYIKSKLSPEEPIFFTRAGGNLGLASNGIHGVDLFVFYDNASKIHPALARIDPVLHSTKRDQFDLSGTLYGVTQKGSACIVSFSTRHESPDIISIISPKGRFLIDHSNQWAQESTTENNWQWRQIPIQENWMVSHMSKKFVTDILAHGRCKLPTLQECFPAHEFILNELLPHFNHLLKTEQQHCPVT